MVTRRALLQGGAAIAIAGCSHRSEPQPQLASSWHTLSFDPSPDAPEGERALAFVPREPGAPLLVALHGRGEAGRGLDVGANAWPRDYHLDKMLHRVAYPPLKVEDLLGMADPKRLTALNQSLEKAPFRGLALACPYSPALSDRSAKGAEGFGRFITKALIPRARAESKASSAREATGLDGVSMGGRLALLVGLTNPEVFGAVGALQPAVRADEAEMFSALAQKAMAKAPIKLRLVSSEDDPFLEPVRAISARWKADSVPHELLITPGNHGYEFNRGPGGAEMVIWHERVLRGLPPPG